MDTMRNPRLNKRFGAAEMPGVLFSKRVAGASAWLPSSRPGGIRVRKACAALIVGMLLSGGMGPLASAQDADLASTLKAVETRYNRLRTLKLRFTQIYRQLLGLVLT